MQLRSTISLTRKNLTIKKKGTIRSRFSLQRSAKKKKNRNRHSSRSGPGRRHCSAAQNCFSSFLISSLLLLLLLRLRLVIVSNVVINALTLLLQMRARTIKWVVHVPEDPERMPVEHQVACVKCEYSSYYSFAALTSDKRITSENTFLYFYLLGRTSKDE